MRQGNFMKDWKYNRLLHALMDSGLGHVTGFGPWNSSRCDATEA